MFIPIENLRIASLKPLMPPNLLLTEIPLTPSAAQVVATARLSAEQIIKKTNDRLLVIIGPCSIHDPSAAFEYGMRLQHQISKHQNELCIIMRVYFEKPRTTAGWKGLINDPNLNDTFNVSHGLRLARKLLVDLIENKVPAATEFLDTIIPQFISDLISWGAIGARTTESQIHRELASGLSMPVGFKNGTQGNIQIAIDALRSAAFPHHFLGVTNAGHAAVVSTVGNNASHIILRGSQTETNYDEKSIGDALTQLEKYEVNNAIMVDCSHGNSLKDYRRQSLVVKDICKQISAGQTKIIGAMIESFLVAGNQNLSSSKTLVYGQSITDACIGWDETEEILNDLATAVKNRRNFMPCVK